MRTQPFRHNIPRTGIRKDAFERELQGLGLAWQSIRCDPSVNFQSFNVVGLVHENGQPVQKDWKEKLQERFPGCTIFIKGPIARITIKRYIKAGTDHPLAARAKILHKPGRQY